MTWDGCVSTLQQIADFAAMQKACLEPQTAAPQLVQEIRQQLPSQELQEVLPSPATQML